jgi:hypothetical protein
LPPRAKTGGKRSVDLREIQNAIRYMARSGGVWRMLPKDIPPSQTVCWWLRSFVRRLLLRTIDDMALMIERDLWRGDPISEIVGSQSIKVQLPGRVASTPGPDRSGARWDAAPRLSRSSAMPRPSTAWAANYLKGRDGNRINAVLAAAGYNFALLLRWLATLLRALFQALSTGFAIARLTSSATP